MPWWPSDPHAPDPTLLLRLQRTILLELYRTSVWPSSDPNTDSRTRIISLNYRNHEGVGHEWRLNGWIWSWIRFTLFRQSVSQRSWLHLNCLWNFCNFLKKKTYLLDVQDLKRCHKKSVSHSKVIVSMVTEGTIKKICIFYFILISTLRQPFLKMF